MSPVWSVNMRPMTHAETAATSRTDLWRGVYDARRAAALSGVPQRTLSHWATTGLYKPSISPEPRTRFWSWLDPLALRTMTGWASHTHDTGFRRAPIVSIRRAPEQLEGHSLSRADLHNRAI